MIAYQRKIMERFMTESQLKNFQQEYKDNRKTRDRDSILATDRDLLILMDYKKGLTYSELCRKYRVGRTSIQSSIRIAALSKI
jgi:Mor family transcriptional regulator